MDERNILDNEEARLAALYRYDVLHTEREAAFDDITELARLIGRTPMATVTLVDREEQWFKSESGVGLEGSSREDSLCQYAIMQPEPLIIEDTLSDIRSVENVFVTQGPKLRFYAGFPLTTSDGFNIGTLCVFDQVPRKLDPEQVEALKSLARQTMAQLELRLQLRTVQKQSRALRTAEKLAVAGRLASTMAHEINNPLQSVTNLLFMAGMQVDGETKDLLTQAQDELRRVTHIVTQTLRFHSQSVRPEPVRLAEIIESVTTLFATRLRQASVAIALEDEQSTLLICYASDLRQVFVNLLSNALDAVTGCEMRRIHIRIRDGYDREGRAGVRVVFSDSGTGISMENRNLILEPFFSTKGARGTGLGLWVSRGILSRHGATLRLRSAVAGAYRGTTWSILLPHGYKLERESGVHRAAV